MNLKDLIAIKALPLDANGFALVPIAHGQGDGVARVSQNFLDGDFPLVGVGSNGLPARWSANGVIQRDALPYGIKLDMDEIVDNSLIAPPSIETVEFLLLDEDDDLIGTYETEDAARDNACEGDQIIRATTTTFMLPDGFAHGVEMEPVTLVDVL